MIKRFSVVSKKLLALLLVVLILMTQLVIPIETSAVNTSYPYPNTDGDFTMQELKDLENISAFVVYCLAQPDYIDNVMDNTEAQNAEMFLKGPEYPVTNFVDTDNKRVCKSQAKDVATKLYGGWTNFLKTIYEDCTGEGKPNSGCSGPDFWIMKDSYRSNKSKIYDDVKAQAQSKGYFFQNVNSSGLPPAYIYNVLAPLFSSCFEKYDPANDTNPITIQGKQWKRKAGSNNGGQIGMILSKPGEEDGVYNCDELAAYVNDDSNKVGYVVLTKPEVEDAIKDDATSQDTAGKKDDLIELFNKQETVGGITIKNSEKFSQCMSGTPLESAPLSTAISIVANWLAQGGSGQLTYNLNPNGSGSGTTLSADVSAFIKGCLESKFGAQMTEIVEREATDPTLPSDLEPDGGGSSEDDDCLQNSDAFIAWFACPAINLVDSFLEKIEDLIKNLLKFDLDQQNENDGLKDAWNIFRSLATVLIMAGFLLALVVKGVKG